MKVISCCVLLFKMKCGARLIKLVKVNSVNGYK